MRKAFWRLLRLIGIGLLVVLVLVISGVLLADRLTPRATGAPGHALALEDGQTEIDRELAPMLAANPGKTGVLMLSDGLDGFPRVPYRRVARAAASICSTTSGTTT